MRIMDDISDAPLNSTKLVQSIELNPIWVPLEVWDLIFSYLRVKPNQAAPSSNNWVTNLTFSGHVALVCKEWRDAMDRDTTNKLRNPKDQKLTNPILMAAQAGKLQLLKFYQQYVETFNSANHLSACVLSRAACSCIPHDHKSLISTAAASGGNIEVIEWLVERKHTIGLMPIAAEYGHVHVLEWVLQDDERRRAIVEGLLYSCFDTCYVSAARAGQLQVLKYLKTRENIRRAEGNEEGAKVSKSAFSILVIPTSISVFERAIEGAAINGHLKVLKWIRKRCSHDQLASASSARSFNVRSEMQTIFPSEKVILKAIGGGHLCILEWLDNPWALSSRVIDNIIFTAHNGGAEFCRAAAAHNKLEILKWLIDGKCVPDAYVGWFLAEQKEYQLLKLVLPHCRSRTQRNISLVTADPSDIVAEVTKAGNTDMVKHLIDQGFKPRADCADNAIIGGHLEILKILINAGCPWRQQGYYNCVAGGNVEIFLYLHQLTKTAKSSGSEGNKVYTKS